MSAGYVYILINPAMPGLAKVGMTTRTSKERQIELSSATGVPSPFILAFEQPVPDAQAAESWVHAELARRGYRPSERREFFTAPLHELVSVVAMSSAAQEPFKVKIEESAAPLDGKNIAEELSKLADDYLIGTGDVLRNSQRALEFYEQAARMGDSYACVKAAELLGQVGGGVKPNAAKALDYLKRALSLDPEGLWYLNGEIAKFYSKANQAVSALPYWRKFAERLDKNANTSIAVMLWRYCFDVVHCGIPHEIPDSTIGLFGPLLISEVKNEATMNRISVYWAEKTQNFIVDCVGKSW